MSNAPAHPHRPRARKSYARRPSLRAWTVRAAVFGGAVLLVGVLQATLFYLLGGTGYPAPAVERPTMATFHPR